MPCHSLAMRKESYHDQLVAFFVVWNAMFVSEEKTRRFGHCMDMNGISLSPNGSYADRICDPYGLKEILFISYVEYSDTCANVDCT